MPEKTKINVRSFNTPHDQGQVVHLGSFHGVIREYCGTYFISRGCCSRELVKTTEKRSPSINVVNLHGRIFEVAEGDDGIIPIEEGVPEITVPFKFRPLLDEHCPACGQKRPIA